MRAPLKKTKPKPFAVYDIETAPNGSLLCIGLYHPNQEKVYHYYSWEDFFHFLQNNCHKPEYQLLFAHNAGNFDLVSFIYWLLNDYKKFDKDNLKIIMTGSTVVFMEYNDFSNKIVFADSNLTFKSSLKKLCKAFEPEVKKLEEFPIQMINQYFHYDCDMVLKYLDADCISLYQIMDKFMYLLDINFFPLTAPSLAMHIFETRYNYDPKTKKQIYKIIKPTTKQDEFLSMSYAGGRVECFAPGFHEHIKTFDINSLYPYIMSFAEIPINQAPIWVHGKDCEQMVNEGTGFYEIKFSQSDKKIPSILWKKTTFNGLIFTYHGEGIFSHHEILNLQKHGAKIEFKKGLFFPETFTIFKEFVTELYDERVSYKDLEEKTGISQPMQMILKLLMNSFYGKFGQKEKSEHLEIMDDYTRDRYLFDFKTDEDGEIIMRKKVDENGDYVLTKNGCHIEYPICKNSIHIYDEEKGLMTVKTERAVKHRKVHVASIITTLARCELYKYLVKYKDSLIYSDTDSVHISSEKCMNIGKELGQMKPEEKGPGIHIGRKMYGIFDKDAKVKEKIKFKGIANNCQLGGDTLSFNDMRKIYEQSLEVEGDDEQVYKFSFNTFPKLKRCLKHEATPAKMVRITKRLKKPIYTTNFKKGKKEWI